MLYSKMIDEFCYLECKIYSGLVAPGRDKYGECLTGKFAPEADQEMIMLASEVLDEEMV